MANFRFAQEKQITTWVRDYYTIEAESLEDAIAIVEQADTSLEELECTDNRVQFDERDVDNMITWSGEINDFPKRYVVIACDVEEEILSR